jgi:hypothetical protein
MLLVSGIVQNLDGEVEKNVEKIGKEALQIFVEKQLPLSTHPTSLHVIVTPRPSLLSN